MFLGEDNGVTSRRVHALLWHLPDESETKTAVREGDWTEAQYVQARIANELMLSRADFVVAHGGKSDPKLLLSPKQRAEEEAERQAARDVRTLLRAQIHGEFIPPAQPGRVFEADTGNGRVEITRGNGGER